MRAMLASHQELMEFSEQLARHGPPSWTISNQLRFFPKVPRLEKYLRGHQVRNTAVLSTSLRATARPTVAKEDWDVLLELMPGTAHGADAYGLTEYCLAKSFCFHANAALAENGCAQGFDLYDLSVCLCLAKGSENEYHKDHGRPYEVRQRPQGAKPEAIQSQGTKRKQLPPSTNTSLAESLGKK